MSVSHLFSKLDGFIGRHNCNDTPHADRLIRKAFSKWFIAYSPLCAVIITLTSHEHNGIASQRQLDFRPTAKETSKINIQSLCKGNPHVTDSFPSQKDNNVDIFPYYDFIIVWIIPGKKWNTQTPVPVRLNWLTLCIWNGRIYFSIAKPGVNDQCYDVSSTG